jgi:small subunit ribosomal protein S9
MATAETVHGYYLGTGRRKSAVARVRIREQAGGTIQVNGRDLESYFSEEKDRKSVRQPLEVCSLLGGIEVLARVEGGGFTGQAGAVRLGVARALRKLQPQFDEALRDGGYLTRDGRMKERKKYGHKGARKSFQFSKR